MESSVLILFAMFFTWGMNMLGASLVFFVNTYNQKLLDSMLGFAAGVMIAASFFSLLVPAFDASEIKVDVFIGFIAGSLCLLLLDRIIPHMHTFSREKEGIETKLHRSFLLMLAMTIHNIPEGLAVGVAIGSYLVTQNEVMLTAAVGLTIGIGIQNFPEGAAVSIPLHRDGISKKKSFMIGQMSGAVEPVMVLVGIALVSVVESILPFALAFAAGAMLYVVIEELIPESHSSNNKDLATIMTMFGLVTMMILDVCLS
jgi:ZIP family zinc transporter